MNTATTLLLVAALLLAGCTGNASDNDEPSGPTQADVNRAYTRGHTDGYAEAEAKFNPPRIEVANRTTRSTLDVEGGQRATFELSLSRDGRLDYDIVRYAGNLWFDVLVFEQQDYQAWLNGQDKLGYGPCSDWYTSSTKRTCDLPAGSWVLVIDNSAEAGASDEDATEEGEEQTLRLRFTYSLSLEA